MSKKIKKPAVKKSVKLPFAFDTETTGLIENVTVKDKLLPEIIDFYGCLFDPKTGKVEEELDLLIKPSRPITEEISNITGITNEMVEKKPPFKNIAEHIKAIIEASSMAIAHNASYDHEVVCIEMERAGYKMTWPRLICSVEQTLHIKGYRLSLTDLHTELFGQAFEGAHRAKTDVVAMVKCITELNKKGEWL